MTFDLHILTCLSALATAFGPNIHADDVPFDEAVSESHVKYVMPQMS